MTDQFTKPTCRGSYALGTACGKCERCVAEMGRMSLAAAKAGERADDLSQCQNLTLANGGCPVCGHGPCRLPIAAENARLRAGLTGERADGAMPSFKFARFVNGVEMAEGVTIEKEPTLERAIRRAVSLCPTRLGTVLVFVPSPLSAAPKAELPREMKIKAVAKSLQQNFETIMKGNALTKPWPDTEQSRWEEIARRAFEAGISE